MSMTTQSKIWIGIGVVVAVAVVGFLIFNTQNDRRGGSGECNNNYSGACVPNVKNDIDCRAVERKVTVTGKDVYNFDADSDGKGCESYDK